MAFRVSAGRRAPEPFLSLLEVVLGKRRCIMAYALASLFGQVFSLLVQNPHTTLSSISRALDVERHTIERAVRLSTGRPFRQLRREILFSATSKHLQGEPGESIKEISFALGFRSPRAFARFVRHSSGLSPSEFRRLREPVTGTAQGT